MDRLFTRIATAIAHLAGQPLAFLLAAGVILVWLVTGPVFGFSDTWQLVINTGTTIVTFLMVFLIQNSQNRDAAAMQAKLDELIRALRDARIGGRRAAARFLAGADGDHRLGGDRTAIRLFGHLAAGGEHRDHDRHLPDGVPDPEFAEPRRRRDPGET